MTPEEWNQELSRRVRTWAVRKYQDDDGAKAVLRLHHQLFADVLEDGFDAGVQACVEHVDERLAAYRGINTETASVMRLIKDGLVALQFPKPAIGDER